MKFTHIVQDNDNTRQNPDLPGRYCFVLKEEEYDGEVWLRVAVGNSDAGLESCRVRPEDLRSLEEKKSTP